MNPASPQPANAAHRFHALLLALVCSALFPACVSSRVEVAKEAPIRRQQWSRLCEDQARMSALVYRPRGHKDRNAAPLRQFEEDLAKRGWELIGECDRQKGEGRGLRFEVWENTRKSPREFVFAYRGTNGGPDWGANFRWFRPALHLVGSVRDHYALARDESLPLIERYYLEKPGVKPIITTTGHSLGGGLAQAVLYAAADKVDHCIAFDSSPVTAWSDLTKEDQAWYLNRPSRDKFSQYRIIRAYERGEVLMFARNAAAAFWKPGPLTRAVEFDSGYFATPIGKHSMNKLAEEIIRLANLPLDPVKEREKYDARSFNDYRYKELGRRAAKAGRKPAHPVAETKAKPPISS